MDTLALLGSTLGLGLVSGVRLYSAVLTVGLGVRFGLIQLHPSLSHLDILTHPLILTVAAAIYLVEFFADKIPWVDSLWDSIHTFIRPLGAALIGATTIGDVDPAAKIAVALLCGGVALSGHSLKAGTRVLVNHSPEPFTNIGLSLIEDVFVVGGTWVSLTHPVFMFFVIIVFLILFAFLSPKIFRLLRIEINGFFGLLEKFLAPAAEGGIKTDAALIDALPQNYQKYWRKKELPANLRCRILCFAGKGVKGLRNSMGYFCLAGKEVFFITRRSLRFRYHALALPEITEAYFKSKLLFDQLVLQVRGKPQYFYFFKDSSNRGETVFAKLQQQMARPMENNISYAAKR
jgi:hypothetical protein